MSNPVTYESLRAGWAPTLRPWTRGSPSKDRTRFASFIKHIGTCWIWTGGVRRSYGKKNQGKWPYGSFWLCGNHMPAHKASWLLHGGNIPAGHRVLHTCDNTLCVNPDHLFTGTSKDNSQDMVKKDRHCRGSRRYNALFTEDQVRDILRMYRPGKKKGSFGCRRIAKLYGVWPQVITDIVRRVTWKHVTKE